MGTQGSSPADALDVFAAVDTPATPLTTSEVAEELDCARRTAYGKLETLADRGDIETKKVGARARVWWRPAEQTGSERTGGGPATDPESKSVFERAQFEELTEAVTDYAIFVLDSEGHVRTWNDGARQIKGYEKAEIVGEHFSTFYTDADREAGVPAENLEKATANGRTEDEGERVRKDGSTFWANVTITAIRGDDGDLQGFIKVTRDMTERHEYEQQLQTEKERFETLVREVKDYAIFLLDEEGYVQTWNDGAREIKGYEEADIVGEHFSTFYTDADREAGVPAENLEKATENGRTEDEGKRVRKDGSTFWANVIITALHDDDGEIRGYAKVTRDMTERHEYEQRLRSQRDELDELNQINTVIRDIDQTLVAATSREEIEQEVCDRLASSETYSAAWIAEYTDDYKAAVPRTSAGISDEYLQSIQSVDAGAETEAGIGANALQTEAIQPVHQLQADRSGEPWRDASLAEGYESAITVPLVYNDVEYGVLTVYAGSESAFDERKVSVMSELGETISHAIAAIRRKEREQTLTALQGSTRQLLHAESREAIGDVIVETLTDELTLSDALVYCFDTSENTLEPVSSSFETEAYASQLGPLTAGADSPVWTAFVEDESQVTDAAIPATGLDQQQTMLLPLGDHGVLAVAVAEQETVDADTRNLVELVAATAEAAFDRVESQANLRERDELLQEQNQRLQRLNQINTIIREIDQGLVQASTREEIQRVVCEQLTKSDRFRFAWIGTPSDVEGGLTPEAWNGVDRGYLDAIELPRAAETGDPIPAASAVQTGDITVVANVAEKLRGGQWRKEAFSREFQSVISVPLQYGDVTYGALSVYAGRPDVFEEMERSVFAELGETIANAIDGVDTKQSLLSDTAIELEFRLHDESASFLARLARQFESEITYEGAIPLSEGRGRLFFVAHNASPDAVDDVLDRSVSVESHEVLVTGDDGPLVESVVSGRTVALSLVEQGASVRRLTVSEGALDLKVDVPSGTDVRGFIERIQAQYDDVEFLARRERERPVQTREGLAAALERSLTDRQLEVLETAYYSGYFASPRRSTGGDVADVLDVSQPTVTEQLRTAQCKLLDLLFAEAAVDG
ncbi:PAS domain S-box protein [Halosimplex sp. J119]